MSAFPSLHVARRIDVFVDSARHARRKPRLYLLGCTQSAPKPLFWATPWPVAIRVAYKPFRSHLGVFRNTFGCPDFYLGTGFATRGSTFLQPRNLLFWPGNLLGGGLSCHHLAPFNIVLCGLVCAASCPCCAVCVVQYRVAQMGGSSR